MNSSHPSWLVRTLLVCSALSSGTAFLAQAASISEIEVNQVLGKARAADGSLSPASRFVAGKQTVVRVFLGSKVKVDTSGKTQSLKVTLGDALLATLFPAANPVETDVLEFPCSSRCGDWKAGTYSFAAAVDSAELTRSGVVFEERQPLRVLAVALKCFYGEGDIREPDEKWKKGSAFTRSVYPVSYGTFKYELHETVENLSDPSYNLRSDSGTRAVWDHLVKMRKPECKLNPQADGCFDAIVGFIKSQIPTGRPGEALQGFTYGAPASIVVNDDGDMPATIAHEVAHMYLIGDEYIGGSIHCAANPPPASYSGTDWNTNKTRTCSDSKAKEPPAGAGEGTLVVASEDRPFEIGGRGALKDSICYMGSNFPAPDPQAVAWTSWPVYTWLFDKFKPVPATASASARRGIAATSRVLSVSGQVSRSGAVTLSPWRAFETDLPVTPQSGTHSIRLVDAAGVVLATQGFTPAFFVHSNPPREVDPAPIPDVVVPFPAGTAKVQVLEGTRLLKEAAVLPHAPVVAVSAPSTSTVSGTETIRWTASHPDGGALWFDVEYSPDGSAWTPLAIEITAKEWTEDFSLLAGGEKATIRVTATDGFNTTAALSPTFRVPEKLPEASIEDPVGGSDIAAGSEVALEGYGYDLLDDEIYRGSQLAWSSSLDGELGRGPFLSLDTLSPGAHVITLTAINGRSLPGTASIGIAVVESGSPATAPASSFVFSPARPVAGQAIRFEDTSVGSPATWAWSFSDGATSTDRNPEHAFAAAGTATATLKITSGTRTSTATRTVSVARSDAGASNSLFVPVVLSSAGRLGSFFTSEMTLGNRGSATARVSLSYTATLGGGDGTLADVLVLGPGQQVVVPDAVSYLRSKGLKLSTEPPCLGTLRADFTGLSFPGDASVLVRTATPVPAGQPSPTGRAGLAYAGVPASRLLTAPVYLAGLRESTADRSNVAVQNAGAPGDGEVVLRASFFVSESASAEPLGTAEVTLSPGGFRQWSLTEIAPGAAGRQGYVRVERVRGSAPYYAYGVLNDNGTSDGSFVVPQSGGAAATAPGISLPVVVEAGAFSTEVVLTNIGEDARSLELTYVSKEIPSGAATARLTIPARAQVLLPGFVDWLRRQPGSVVPPAGPGFVGPLLVTARTSSLEGISVSGRTSNPAGSGSSSSSSSGSYGLFYAGVPWGASSTTPVWLMGLKQDAENRTNAAFVNTGEEGSGSIVLKVTVFDSKAGSAAGETTVTVEPRALVQVDRILAQVAPGVTSGWARVSPVSGDNPFIAYAVVNDGAAAGQRSGDGAFVLAEVPAP